jgi:hypothetical protein
LFSCEVETDEVVVADEFSSGTTFDIGDLAYVPVKFCLDSYPAVVRSMTEEGVATDIKGEITRKLARGASITVNPDETIMVVYIADYEEGMVERCQIGDVYNTRTNQCEKLIEEGEDTILVLNNITVLTVSKDEALLGASQFVGDKEFSITDVRYTCWISYPDMNFDAPSPDIDCWSVDLLDPEGSIIDTRHGMPVERTYYSLTPYLTAEWDSDLDNCPTPDPADCKRKG